MEPTRRLRDSFWRTSETRVRRQMQMQTMKQTKTNLMKRILCEHGHGHVPTPVHLSEPASCSHYPILGIPCMLTIPLQVIKVLQLQMFHVPLLDDKRQVKSNLINILLHLPTRKAYATLLTPNDYAMPPPKLNGLRN